MLTSIFSNSDVVAYVSREPVTAASVIIDIFFFEKLPSFSLTRAFTSFLYCLISSRPFVRHKRIVLAVGFVFFPFSLYCFASNVDNSIRGKNTHNHYNYETCTVNTNAVHSSRHSLCNSMYYFTAQLQLRSAIA